MAKTTKKKAEAGKVINKKAVAVKATKKKTTITKAAKKKTAAAKATKKTTGLVLQHHLQALLSRKMNEIIKDYCEESLVCTPMGAARGLKEIRDTFTGALQMLTPEAMANMKVSKQEINGDYAYVLWSAPPVVTFAGDTFHVHDGVIMMQTFVGQM